MKPNNGNRVPVVSQSGKPLMPTNCKKARKLVSQKKAKGCWNRKLGVYYIQLLFEPSGYSTQKIAVGIDPGSSFTGVAIQSRYCTHIAIHAVLPRKRIAKLLEQRNRVRRTRRGRRINRKQLFKDRAHRQARFNNRNRKAGVPPSIDANKIFELHILVELLKLYPVSHIAYELVKAEGNKSFSPVMVGQKVQLARLKKLGSLFGFEVQTRQGYQTSNLRKYLHLPKNKEDKAAVEPATHATDAITLACSCFMDYRRVNNCTQAWVGNVELTTFDFFAIERPRFSYRQLQLEVPEKRTKKVGRKRRKQKNEHSYNRKVYGGSVLYEGSEIRRGDLVEYRNKKTGEIVRGYASGVEKRVSDKGKVSYYIAISGFCSVKKDWKRFQKYSPKSITLIQRNTGVVLLKKEYNAFY